MLVAQFIVDEILVFNNGPKRPFPVVKTEFRPRSRRVKHYMIRKRFAHFLKVENFSKPHFRKGQKYSKALLPGARSEK